MTGGSTSPVPSLAVTEGDFGIDSNQDSERATLQRYTMEILIHINFVASPLYILEHYRGTLSKYTNLHSCTYCTELCIATVDVRNVILDVCIFTDMFNL